jgi:cytochrome c oxidase assembly factor 2
MSRRTLILGIGRREGPRKPKTLNRQSPGQILSESTHHLRRRRSYTGHGQSLIGCVLLIGEGDVGSDAPRQPYRMSISRVIRFTQRRTFMSSLFGFTFFATVLTVSASNILPCPARPQRGRFADGDSEGTWKHAGNGRVTVSKRPRKWIKETPPP